MPTKKIEKKMAATRQIVAEARGLTIGQVERLQEARSLSIEDIKELPEGRLHRAIRRLDLPDLPRAREAFRRRQLQDENGFIPPNALPYALRDLDSLRLRSRALQPSVAGIPTGQEVKPQDLMGPFIMPTAGLSPAHVGWTSLGPGNIGGRTRAIIPHPTNQNVLWAGSAGGGVWRTDNAGQSWTAVDDLMANLAISCMAIDPSDPNQIYAGTGEGFFNSDAIRGAGIFRTTDGTTWAQLPATIGTDYQSINSLAISKNGQVLLAATPLGIFRSADANRMTWTTVLSDPISCVVFHPTDSKKAIAGGLNTGRAYYSTDSGQTWKLATQASPWSGRVELTYARNDSAIVYASVQMSRGQIWMSIDGGKSFKARKSLLANGFPSNYLGDQGWYANTIWAGDPSNSNLVLVGGLNLFKSTDGGNTLIDISTWYDDRSAHADHHCIVSGSGYDGTTNKAVYFGNDGGIYMTQDVSTVGNDSGTPRINGWVKLDNTYGVTQFYSGAGNASTGTIIGGAQDNGTLRFTTAGGSQQWSSMFGGDGGFCAADQTNPDYFYGEYVYLNIHRSTDGGGVADYISGQYWNSGQGVWAWKPVPYSIPDAMNRQALFIAPFILDPNSPDRILGGGLSLWRTNDARTPNTNNTGPSWTSIKSSAGSYISAIAVAVGNPDLIWIGHVNGQLYKAVNGTKTNPIWQRMDHGNLNPIAIDRYCTRVTIDPRDHQVVYVTFGGYAKNNVWKTTDGGVSWDNIGSTLPEAPVRSLSIHPRKSNSLYLGTEVGIFASEDTGNTWSPTNEGPTNCSVDDLFWMNEQLVCVTHGRGMFILDLSTV